MCITLPDIKEVIKKNFEDPNEWLNMYGNFYVIEYVGANYVFRGGPIKSTIKDVLNTSTFIKNFPKTIKDMLKVCSPRNTFTLPESVADITLKLQKSNVLGGSAKDKANFLVYDKDYTVDKRANICKEWKESASYVRLGLGIPGVSKEKKVMKRNDMIMCLVRSWREGKWN